MSRRSKINVQRAFSKHFADFLEAQLGKEAASVKTFLHGNLITVFITPYTMSGGHHFPPNGDHEKQLFATPARKFDLIDPLLMKEFFEEMTGCKVVDLYFIAGQKEIRLMIVALRENLENKFIQSHEVQYDRQGSEILQEAHPWEARRDEAIWLAHNAEHLGKWENSESYASSIKEENESWWQDAAFATN